MVQPNMDSIPTGSLYTLEHLFAIYFREYMDDIIDISPMGCRTGFYLIKFGKTPLDEIKDIFIDVLNKVVKQLLKTYQAYLLRNVEITKITLYFVLRSMLKKP